MIAFEVNKSMGIKDQQLQKTHKGPSKGQWNHYPFPPPRGPGSVNLSNISFNEIFFPQQNIDIWHGIFFSINEKHSPSQCWWLRERQYPKIVQWSTCATKGMISIPRNHKGRWYQDDLVFQLQISMIFSNFITRKATTLLKNRLSNLSLLLTLSHAY